MKLTIERTALLKALAHVQSVVERRSTIPILSNVRIEASSAGQVRLTATDMDLAIVEEAPATVAKAGATTTSAHTLYDIVRKLPEGSQLEFAPAGADGRLVLRSGRAKYELPCLPVEDFPVMAEGELPYEFSLPAADLRRLIAKSRFAISTEETRYYLNGIYLHAAVSEGQGRLRAVATDGHRLARVDVALPDGAAGIPGVIVPRKAVAELAKLIEENDGAVAVALSESKIRFGFGGATLTSKLIDGAFPDYERVIPSGNDKALNVGNKELRDAVDRVSTISTEKSRAIKLSISKGKLVLSAASPEAGSGTEELDASFDDGPIEIGFNARYVLDMTDQIEGKEIAFLFSDSASPTLVRDSADDSAVYVIMPMRV
ncbi:MAG: DNA polymerase III subunit beta [Alphaproteobacteria bacterium]